jgi:drug/metabolite transporter (DMT)-like permease
VTQGIGARTLVSILATLVLWASAFAGIRAALEAYPPGELAFLRFVVASLVMGIYVAIARPPLPARRDIPAFLVLGFLGVTTYHLCLNYGEQTVTAGAASLLVASNPVFVALLAGPVLGERLRPWGWAGIGVAFAGVAVVALGEGGGVRFDPRAFVILLAALAGALYFVYQKPYLVRYGPLPFTAYAIWAGTLFLAVYLPGTLRILPHASIDATLAVVYMGIFPGAAAYVTYTYALSRAPAPLVSSFLYLLPVLAIFIAWVWRHEVPGLLSLVGGAVAVGGVVIVNTRGRR